VARPHPEVARRKVRCREVEDRLATYSATLIVSLAASGWAVANARPSGSLHSTWQSSPVRSNGPALTPTSMSGRRAPPQVSSTSAKVICTSTSGRRSANSANAGLIGSWSNGVVKPMLSRSRSPTAARAAAAAASAAASMPTAWS
jgi:hypothetical protein